MATLPQYMTESETADYIRGSRSTLQKDRLYGRGIPFVKMGRRVLYRRADVDAYLAKNVVRSTSEARS